MKKFSIISSCVLFAFILIASSYAKFAKPDEAIRYRKAVMTLIQQHFKDMGAVVKGKVDFEPKAFSDDAEVVKMLATLPWEAFLEPGSDKGKTNMSSSVLEKKTQFEKTAASFETATAELAVAARNEDLKAIKSQFGKVAQNCGACHKKFQK